MNKSYQDKFTRYHDKPTINGESSSNNGWIYSAYGKYLAPDTGDEIKRVRCAADCLRSLAPLKMDRSPNDLHPPLSKDEIIGLVSLDLLFNEELEDSHWNFCNLEYEPKKLTISSIITAAKALYDIRKEHRNYVWQIKIIDAYALAFYLAPHDQYYVRKYNKKSTSILQKISFYLNFVSVLTSDNKSTKMMLWLQLEDLKHPLLRFINKEKYVRAYFNEDHPFVKGLK